MTRGTPQLDWEGLLWETRGYLGLGEADPVPFNELRETAEVNGWSEREFREVHRNSEQLVNVGTLDEPRVVLDDTVSDTNDEEPNTGNDTPEVDIEKPASNRASNGEIPENVELDTPPEIEACVFPEDLKGVAQWLTWKATDDGRKVPRAPYEHPDWPDKFVSAQDPDVWRDFDTAADWSDRLGGYGLAFTIRNREDYPDEQFVLVDYDDARDPDTGEIHPVVREHIERADSYTDVSTSGTGVHIFCRGGLPEGVKAIGAELPQHERFPGAEIEVYDSGRYSAMTGDHIVGTPRITRECQSFIDDLVDEFATVAEGTPDRLLHEPEKSKDELADVETTTDIQDVFDAIQHTGPRDIRLRSTVTHERADGTKSLDPSWAQSKSGTRLAEVGDGWVYRKGMHGLDAMQVVALEEGIITRIDEYPTGEDFWATVDALRQRGAHVPEYEPEEGEPVSALPLARLMALDPSERKRAARKRGLDWPTTTEARDRLRNRIFQAMRHGEDVVIDAPTALGKTYTVATEPWLNHSDVTDDSPVVHFSETREARDDAAASSRDVTGVTAATLKGRKERCSVARGDHDPAENDDDEDPDLRGKRFVEYLQQVFDTHRDRVYDATLRADDEAKNVYYHNVVSLMRDFYPSDEWIVALVGFDQQYDNEDALHEFVTKLERRLTVDWLTGASFSDRYTRVYQLLKEIEAADGPKEVLSLGTLTEDVMEDRDSFEEALDLKNFYRKGNYQWPKYILMRVNMERHDNRNVKIQYGNNVNVEHILPQNPSNGYWGTRFNELHRGKWTNRLGNLVLLDGRKNYQASNRPFPEKYEQYFQKKSDFAITNELDEQTKWTPTLLKERHERLKDECLSIWVDSAVGGRSH